MAKVRFRLSGITTCTTYNFRVIKEHGWAACTVDDHSSALMITSDWGDWAHTWGHNNFGTAKTLTEFIAQAGPDYVAGKLVLNRKDMQEFDVVATTKFVKAELRNMRKSGDISEDTYRSNLSYIAQIDGFHGGESRYVELLDNLIDDGGRPLFEIPDEWGLLKYREANEYGILLRSILPALKAACKKAVANIPKPVDNQPHG